MGPGAHLIQAAVTTAALYPAFGGKSFIVGASVVLIDVDHIIPFYAETKSLSVRKFFEYHRILFNNLEGFYGLSMFHTVECWLLLWVLGLFWSDATFILMGFLFHFLFDQVDLIRLGYPFGRAFSVIEYCVKRKKHITTLKQVLENKERKVTPQ